MNIFDHGNFDFHIIVDLQKAFDTANHDILLKKLNFYGIRGILNQWFYSYWTNQKQYLSITSFNSNVSTITCGIPQSFVLGHLLMYANNLHITITHSKIFHFADDTNLLNVVNECPKKLNKYLNFDLQKSHKLA